MLFDFDKVSTKRKIIACLIIALPAIYIVFNSKRFADAGISTIVLYSLLAAGVFLVSVVFCAGMLAAAFMLIILLMKLLIKLLLGVKDEEGAMDFATGVGYLGYLAIAICLGIGYYLIFSGKVTM